MGDLRWTGRSVTLADPAMLAERIGYVPARVSADAPPRAGFATRS
jgi:hypothetical protein